MFLSPGDTPVVNRRDCYVVVLSRHFEQCRLVDHAHHGDTDVDAQGVQVDEAEEADDGEEETLGTPPWHCKVQQTLTVRV